MEVFQLKTNSWFLPRELFVPDPLSPQHPPLLCHILTGALAVALPHRLSAQVYEQNLMGYLWRFKTGEGVLRVYNVTLRQVLRSEAELEVLCERICFRLEAIINSLSVQEQLYLIAGVVRTVQVLSAKFGFFGLTLEMVGLEQNGVVRVWINSNHAENKRQHELSSEEQQFVALMQLFSQLKIQNRLINAYLQNITEMGLGFKHHADYHYKFLRLHHLQALEGVAVGKMAAGKAREREVESCPASSLHLANETADMTSTTKEHSINTKKFELSKSTEFVKRFPISPRLQANKENRRSSEKNAKVSLKSSFCKASIGFSPQSSSVGYCQILATRARLQESLMIDESFEAQTTAPVKLQLLGKMGKVCQSMTAQELILEQFKAIYQ